MLYFHNYLNLEIILTEYRHGSDYKCLCNFPLSFFLPFLCFSVLRHYLMI